MEKHQNRRMQFVSDRLVQQVVDGIKTASVVRLGEVQSGDGDYDDPLVVGEYYDVFDSRYCSRATIRVTEMGLCCWNDIPEGLWRGEANSSLEEFKADHMDYFDNPQPDFEFVAYYFELVKQE